ncbi:MAG: hypothetical protein ACQETV_03415, partial [Actinomycetota bacterium]
DALAEASGDPGAVDPVVRVATLPGTAAPAVAHRTYRGPQGHYLEHVALLGPDGAERYRSPRRPMVLEGESITTDVATEITGIELDSAEEHALVCYVDKAEVGRVPVFVETPDGGDPRLATKHTLAQALKKSTILWVTIPQTDKRGRPAKPVHRPVWFVADGTTVYVLSGPGEQELPGIDEVSEVTLSARGKDAQSQIAEIACAVEAVDVDDPRYARFESQALTRRLNLTDGDGAAQRWRQTCRLYALTPQLGLPEEPEKAAAGGGKAAASGGAKAAEGAKGGAGQGAGEGQAAAGETAGGGSGGGEAAQADAPQIDQEVYDKLIAEGAPERTARAKAKAAFVRAQRKAEREQAEQG